jgi:GH25 family lysozyme M1 (1,4-beta-N-acetylmuramidase)
MSLSEGRKRSFLGWTFPQGKPGMRAFLGVIIGILCSWNASAQRPIGIDVSDYQSPSIDWSTLKNSYGITFGWAKSSEGLSTSGGTQFPTYCANAKSAGVIIGPYHFARYDLNTGTNGAVAEANYFWSVVQSYVIADGLTLVPMLDVEATNSGYNATTLSQWVDTWCTTVSNNAYAAGLKLKPAIYISSSHASTWFTSAVTNWNLDVADWAYGTNYMTSEADAEGASSPPAGITPWTSWQFWQYDDQDAAEPYTTGDGDIFNGTFSQLTNTMLVVQAGPAILTQPTNLTTASGTNAVFRVSATGNGTLQYQWLFDGTNLSGATASSCVISNVQTTNAGEYAVSVTDSTGKSTQSASVYLAVIAPLSNYPGSTVVAPQGMVDWWPADGNGDDIFGTAMAIPHGNLYYGPGEAELAFQFDGSTAYLYTGAADVPIPWTACMWVNRASGAGDAAGILEDGTNSIKLEQFDSPQEVGISIITVGDYVFSPAYTAPIGTWVHLAFVCTTNGTSLYVNGAFQASMTNTIPLPRAYIGAGYVPSSAKYIDFMAGNLDEVMLFNRALTSNQISSIYNTGGAGLVRAAQLLGGSMPLPGVYTLKLEGETGKPITVYTSTNLTNWSSTATIGNPTGTTSWTDTRATNFPEKFYRAEGP